MTNIYKAPVLVSRTSRDKHLQSTCKYRELVMTNIYKAPVSIVN